MTNQALWATMRAAWSAIEPHYEPVIEHFIDQTRLDNRAWGLLLAAIAFEPESVSPAQLLVRSPYTSPEKYLSRLHSLAEGGYLVESGQGEFMLSERGKKAALQFIHDVRVAMAEADPLPKAKTMKVCETLDALVAACLNTPQPPDTWSIRHSFRLMPEKDPPLPYLEQAFSCLSAYRDDAHLAAWQESGLSATELEVLTVLKRHPEWTLEMAGFGGDDGPAACRQRHDGLLSEPLEHQAHRQRRPAPA